MEKRTTTILNKTQAVAQANRCLHCYDAPCHKGCPAGVNVPQFIARIASEDFKGAAAVIREANPMGFACAQVCPAAAQCEANCNSKKAGGCIPIAALQEFAMQVALESECDCEKAAADGKSVAIIGGGPSGVAAASVLVDAGYKVTVFEKGERLGGTPMEEIPNNRLNKELFDKELKMLTAGADVKLGVAIDADKAAEIAASYDAVYVSCGLGEPNDTVASDAEGVYKAEAFLRLANSDKLDDAVFSAPVYVQGGGNTALDAACTAKKLGASRSFICYRRSQNEMPAWKDEFLAAVDQGVEFLFQTQILDAEAVDGKVAKVVLAPVDLVPSESGRPKPVVKEDEKYTLKASAVITATGKKSNNALLDAFKAAGADKVFAGGDVTNGGATVVKAVADGKKAAADIIAYLK